MCINNPRKQCENICVCIKDMGVYNYSSTQTIVIFVLVVATIMIIPTCEHVASGLMQPAQTPSYVHIVHPNLYGW
jgi:hypothetical protein